MSARIGYNREEIAAFCEKWGVAELALFGSVLRDDFTSDSDVDVLVTFRDRFWPSYWEWPTMREELRQVFGREVDLVPKGGLRNPYRRRAILETAEVVYAA